MTDFSIRDRLFRRSASEDRPPPPRDAPASSTEDGPPPFTGYDRLDMRQVINGLSDHTQVELEAVESYERAHKSREPVLDKLRYMRGREPVPGYDALEAAEVVAALQQADMATIKKVRGYERKFRNRPAVLDEVVRVHHLLLAANPAPPAPGYQPLGGAALS